MAEASGGHLLSSRSPSRRDFQETRPPLLPISSESPLRVASLPNIIGRAIASQLGTHPDLTPMLPSWTTVAQAPFLLLILRLLFANHSCTYNTSTLCRRPAERCIRPLSGEQAMLATTDHHDATTTNARTHTRMQGKVYRRNVSRHRIAGQCPRPKSNLSFSARQPDARSPPISLSQRLIRWFPKRLESLMNTCCTMAMDATGKTLGSLSDACVALRLCNIVSGYA